MTEMIEMTSDVDHQHPEIRLLVRGYYSLQKLRIEMGNRIVANFRSRLGLQPSEGEESDAVAKKALNIIRQDYKTITEGVAAKSRFPTPANFKGTGVIHKYAELVLVSQWVMQCEAEEDLKARILKSLEGIPIYDKFLADYRGIGPMLAGIIISEIDIRKATYVSSVWAYCGFDVAPDGRGRGRYAEHLVEREFIKADGTTATKKGLTFKPLLKSKLWLAATGFIKAGGKEGEKHHLALAYRQYKHRLENHPKHKDKAKSHRNNMALRYIAKLFLQELYLKWREIEGLPVTAPYAERKLGLYHGQGEGQSE